MVCSFVTVLVLVSGETKREQAEDNSASCTIDSSVGLGDTCLLKTAWVLIVVYTVLAETNVDVVVDSTEEITMEVAVLVE